MIAFTVPGPPVAKQRPRVTLKRGRVMTYTPKATAEYERNVAWTAKAAGAKPIEGPVAVTLRFFGGRGDVDNRTKSVLDGMNAICYADDEQVKELHVYVATSSKKPRTEVEVRGLP